MSVLLDRLQAQLSTTEGADDRAVVSARIAGYMARIGRFEDAGSLIGELRGKFSDGRSGRASAWIMWAESLLHYYSDLNPRALDRVARSQLLAIALRDSQLVALSSAWKAHMEFETSRFGAMAESLKIAFKHVTSDNHSANTRMCMVVADALLTSGDFANGQRWFMHGRDSALIEGDQASIEALVYNRAAFRLAWLRAQRCFGEVLPADTSTLRQEIQSAKNLQNLTQVRALTEIVKLCEARAATLDGLFDVAVKQMSEIRLATGTFAAYNFSDALVSLEIAYCQTRLGEIEDATSIVSRLEGVEFEELDKDEQLVAAWMRREMAATDGRLGQLHRANERLAMTTSAYTGWLEAIRKSVEDFRLLEPVRPSRLVLR